MLAKKLQRSVWTIVWCSILLVDNFVHTYSPFPPQCRNELRPHEYNVTVCVHRHPILILVLKEVWPDDAISSNGTPHSHFLLAKRVMGMLIGLRLSPEAQILLVDVPSHMTVSLVTKENQMQQARVIFNPLTDIFRKCFSFCFIVTSLPLQDLNFVRKELTVIMEDPQNWCPRNASFLWDRTCRFSGGFLKESANSKYSQELWLNDVDHCVFCGHLPHFVSPEMWPPNVALSFYQVHCSCQNLSCIAAV